MALYSCQTLGLCLRHGVDFSLPLLQAEEEEEEEEQQQEPHLNLPEGSKIKV